MIIHRQHAKHSISKTDRIDGIHNMCMYLSTVQVYIQDRKITIIRYE